MKILVLMALLIINTFSIRVKFPSVELVMHYPYTCGTWFNRGKDTCNAMKEHLISNGFQVNSSVKAHSVSERSEGYDGFFNVYIVMNGSQRLLATSNESSDVFHNGLKYFAYNFFQLDPATGERKWMDTFPHRDELLQFILKRVIEETRK